MKITEYILAFAELLEKGALLAKEDPTKNVGLKPEDRPMHIAIASVLRKALHSSVMAEIVDELHAGYNQVVQHNQLLQNELNKLLQPAPVTDVNAAAVENAVAEPVQPSVTPEVLSTPK